MDGFGGACRTATGTEWARGMVMMMAMQGLGKPGVNFGSLQQGAPLDNDFYFPGYSEGGISGELHGTAMAPTPISRMPHVLTMNPVQQMVPRQRLPEAIMDGLRQGLSPGTASPTKASSSSTNIPRRATRDPHALSIRRLALRHHRPKPAAMIEMYRHEKWSMVVNQSIWIEGEAKFADVILPACTEFERWDISEFANSRRLYPPQHSRRQSPRGRAASTNASSRSANRSPITDLHRDPAIAWAPARSSPKGARELDWGKRMYKATDLPKQHQMGGASSRRATTSCRRSAESHARSGLYRWFAEGRHKDVPEPIAAAVAVDGRFPQGAADANRASSSSFPNSLKRLRRHRSRAQSAQQICALLGGTAHRRTLYAKYPLQMISTHPRYSFHT